MNWELSIIIILAGSFAIFWYSQTKFKTKMLCVFHGQDIKRIETWIPMEARHVRFKKNKKGDIGLYYVMPEYFEYTVWDKGINKMFPVLVPTMEWYWFSPYPTNPKAIQRYDPKDKCLYPAVSWHTPELRNAAWEEHQYRAFTKAAGEISGGKKQNAIQKWLPLIALGIALIALFLAWRVGNYQIGM